MRPIHLRLSALCLPLFFWRQKIGGFGRQDPDADCVAGTRLLSAPATAGEGTTGARAASEPWWRGRGTRSFVFVAEDSLRRKKRASEMFGRHQDSCGACSPAPPPPRYARSPSPAVAVADELRRVEACAPSTTLLHRVVPLPRFRGGGKRRHIFSKRLALPLRIFALSSSLSGTVCIHSSAGGFMTNGQSTANRI